MRASQHSIAGRAALGLLAAVLALTAPVQAGIVGVEGRSFLLTAQDGYIHTPDGLSLYVWGYGVSGGGMQYPGPTLIVAQGDTVTIRLTNQLTEACSIVFPGQTNVLAAGNALTQPGLLTREALPGGVVTYRFKATNAGTFPYYSGTRAELQIEMGLTGTLIVRPKNFNPAAPTAYNDTGTRYDREYLFFLSEMDPLLHQLVETQGVAAVEGTSFLQDYQPNYWFINGRAAPDVLMPDGVPWLPTQPYGCLPQMHPGDKVLLRMVGGGREPHPFHTHGNHVRVIAENGQLLRSRGGTSIDLSYEVFMLNTRPGETMDALFQWTAAGLGWDIYGHQWSDPMEPNEYVPDHGKRFPVELPALQDLAFGAFHSGSPFLGVKGDLPPGEGGLNLDGGYHFMWHSHAEAELLNYGTFPGGMLTMMVIQAPNVPLP